jgi:hypothetical protein
LSNDDSQAAGRAGSQGRGKLKREDRSLAALTSMAAVILALLMTYSIVLLHMGLTLEMVAAAECALCLLTVQVVRCLIHPNSPPSWLPRPWSILPPGPGGGDRGAA